MRFIEHTELPVFGFQAFSGMRELREWSFASGASGWRVQDVATERFDEIGWWLEPEERRVVIRLRLPEGEELAADEIDGVEVRIDGRRMSHVVLHWAAPGDHRRPENRLSVATRTADVRTHFLPVGDVEGWRGTIDRLWLTAWTAGGQAVHLRSLRLLRRGSLEAAPQPWRVSSGQEQRLAFAAVPGQVLERTLKVPPDADLRFAYGGLGELPDSLRFRILAGPEGALHEIFLQPRPTEGWQSAKVDLADFAEQEIRLRFEVEADQPVDPRHGAALWAHPEVLADSREGPAGASSGAGEPPPNIVFIVLDTLRADRLSLYGHGRSTSPHLDAWARRHGAVFETAVAAAGWTLPAHASLFTGLDAARHGVNWRTGSAAGLPLLAERLRRLGYATEAVTGGGYLDPTFGLDRGFERYRSWGRGATDHLREPPKTFDQALASLRRLQDRPFFLFVHSYAVHTPYHPWQPFFSRFSDHDPLRELVFRRLQPEDRRLAIQVKDGHGSQPLEGPWHGLAADQYDAGIARMDGLLRPLLEALSEPRLARRTVVVVTSDHGEMLGERELWQHNHLFDPVLLVPLVIAAPDGAGAGERIERQVRSVDILPTLLELAGLEPVPDLDGVSLVPLLEGETGAVPNVAWSYGSEPGSGLSMRLRNRWKLLLHDDAEAPWKDRLRAFRVGSRALAERGEEIPEELRAAVRTARQRLLDQMPGLRLRFANPEDQPELFLEIDSTSSIADRIKIPDLSCECVESPEPGRLRIRVPPGHQFTAILADVRETQLLVTLFRRDGSRQRLTVDLLGLDRPLAFTATPVGWEIEAGEPPASGVGLWLHDSGVRAGNTMRDVIDEELRRSLEALGYVH